MAVRKCSCCDASERNQTLYFDVEIHAVLCEDARSCLHRKQDQATKAKLRVSNDYPPH
jgi:hypothetical protein